MPKSITGRATCYRHGSGVDAVIDARAAKHGELPASHSFTIAPSATGAAGTRSRQGQLAPGTAGSTDSWLQIAYSTAVRHRDHWRRSSNEAGTAAAVDSDTR